MDINEKAIKIILLGETGVGKTNLINVFIGSKFALNTLSTMTCYSYEGKYKYKNEFYNYTIWDTAGQEKYRSLNKIFVRDAQIIILVYSIIDRASFNELNFWLQYAKENKGDDDYILGLVGNKSDLFLNETVTEEEVMKFASDKKIKFVITSALEKCDNYIKFVNGLIKDYIKIFIKNKNEKNENPNDLSISINNESTLAEKKKCCK